MTTEAIEIPEIPEIPEILEIPENIIEAELEAEKPTAKKKKIRMAFIILSVILSVTLISLTFVYFRISTYFETHFFPNTIINDINVSHMTASEVTGLIFEQSLLYQLEVTDQDGEIAGILKAAEIGFFIDIDTDVETVLRNQDERKWIFEYSNPSDHLITYDINFDSSLLTSLIREWDIFSASNIRPPENAYLSEYNEEFKGYEIIPETRGSWIDFGKAKRLIIDAVYERQSQINLEDGDCYLRAKITADDRNLNQRATILNRITGTNITYDWNGNIVVLDGDLIHQWIIEEAGKFTIDEEAVREFVVANAKENDTYGQKRNFITTAGVERRLPGGGYGWRTDRSAEVKELIELINYGVVMDREPIYSVMGWHKGQDDIGPSYVEIDLGNQHLYLYIDGEIILETGLVSGNMERGWGTPEGVFGLTYKERNAILRGETYRTPVSYWMPFNGNIGMHDATWRGSFGGDIYLDNGSHGCINLPFGKAKEIYSYIAAGFPVICYY